MKHIKCIIFAFREIFSVRIEFLDSIALFIKSCNLYFSFLAFTDKERPFDQLHRAMQCAILSAIYDYDTDWERSWLKDEKFFLDILNRHIEAEDTKMMARELFFRDSRQELSEKGLERGSIALLFYVSVINSEWMKEYSANELQEFGRKLQMVDDCLDAAQDRKAGDKNCFNQTFGREKMLLITELREFFESDFYNSLASNSIIYRILKRKCRKSLKTDINPSFLRQLIASSRPLTAVFAFVLTIIGFRFYSPINWMVAGLSALAFGGITASIMIFNDLIDRNHDQKKGKYFTSENYGKVFLYWIIVSSLALIVLFSSISNRIALWCVIVWLIGIFYSLFIYKFHAIQNFTVAFCSAAPVLCGSFYAIHLSIESVVLFFIVLLIILLREICKDFEDINIDKGYKNTIPAVLWGRGARIDLIGLPFLIAAFLILYNHPVLLLLAVSLAVFEFFVACRFLFYRKNFPCREFLDLFILILLISIIIIQ